MTLGAAACASPFLTFAQQPRVRRIGYLVNSYVPGKPSPTYRALVEGLRELGWVEGKNMEFRVKATGNRNELFRQLAAEMVQENVDVIVTGSLAATRAAKAATQTIPIVFASAANPVELGLVASLARPGGNATGFALMVQDLPPKRYELLREILPAATRIGRLFHGGADADAQRAVRKQEEEAAQAFKFTLVHIALAEMKELQQAFEAASANRIDAFNIKSDGWLVEKREHIAELALRHRMPLMCADRRFVEAGALVSYGQNFPHLYKRTATLVDKILKHGAKPTDLPVEEVHPELAINRATAAKLGITFPQSIYIRQPEQV